MIEGFKIGLIGPIPPPYGGIANQTEQLKNLLEEEEIQVDFIPTNAPYFPRWISKIKGVRAIVRLVPYMRALWLAAGKVSVFHVMANSGWAWHLFAAPAIWVAYLRKRPVVLNYRGGNADKFFESGFAFVNPTLLKTNKIIVPSEFLVGIFKKYGLKAEVIPNIIDTNLFTENESKKNGQRKIQRPHIVVTRNLDPVYDNETAILAFNLLREHFPDGRLTIAGSGQDREKLEALVDNLDLKSNIRFSGQLNRREIADLLQTADVMINPSLVDNMPNSVLEALSCNVPVVSTNVGGINHILKNRETAILVSPGDYKAIADGIYLLLNDSALKKKMLSNAKATVRGYTWDTLKHDWLRTYDTISR